MSKCPFIRSMRTSGERMDSLQRWDKTMEFTIADKYKSKQQCCCWKSDQIQFIVLMAMRMIFDGLGLYSSLQSHGRGKHQQTGEKSKQFIYLRIKTINKVLQESLNGDMKEMIKFTYELKCFKDALDIRVNTQFVVIS